MHFVEFNLQGRDSRKWTESTLIQLYCQRGIQFQEKERTQFHSKSSDLIWIINKRKNFHGNNGGISLDHRRLHWIEYLDDEKSARIDFFKTVFGGPLVPCFGNLIHTWQRHTCYAIPEFHLWWETCRPPGTYLYIRTEFGSDVQTACPSQSTYYSQTFRCFRLSSDSLLPRFILQTQQLLTDDFSIKVVFNDLFRRLHFENHLFSWSRRRKRAIEIIGGKALFNIQKQYSDSPLTKSFFIDYLLSICVGLLTTLSSSETYANFPICCLIFQNYYFFISIGSPSFEFF